MNELNSIISDTCRYFHQFCRESFICPDSIPVLWFGDLDAYLKSDIKVVTVGLNPSLKEFESKEERFDSKIVGDLIKSECWSEREQNDYKKVLNEYFEQNPYKKWFNYFNKTLFLFNSGFYQSGNTPNRALHLDWCTSLATVPTWGSLSSEKKKILEEQGQPLCMRILEFLAPDVVLLIPGKTYLKSATLLTKISSSKCNLYQISSLPDTFVIQRHNVRGTPCFTNEDIDCIKQAYGDMHS